MTGLELVFVIIAVAGLVFLFASLFFGELAEFIGDFGGEGLDSVASDLSVPEWHDLKVIAAAAVGLGAFGFIALQLNMSASFAIICGCAGFVGTGAGAFFGVLKPLAKQQSNSLIGRASYIDREARVTLELTPGKFGLVEFLDDNGARVQEKAWSEKPLPKGSQVLIYEVSTDGVLVMPVPYQIEP